MTGIEVIILAMKAIGIFSAWAAIALWNKILEWAEEILFPWFKEHLPFLEKYVREAFVILDNVATPIRSLAKNAWEEIRKYLLSLVVEFVKEGGKYVKRTIFIVLKQVFLNILSKIPLIKDWVIQKVEKEEIMKWDELQQEVRNNFIRKSESPKIDVTELRDKELKYEYRN